MTERQERNGLDDSALRVALLDEDFQSVPPFRELVIAMSKKMGPLVACILVLALCASFFMARKSVAPISEMCRVASEMRRGDFQVRVRSIPKDEFGRLGVTLNQLGRDLEKLEGFRRDFVANVSHEIKTPLTSIKGYVETLLEGDVVDPHHQMRFLRKIDRNVTRLDDLVQDLLSLARTESPDAGIELEIIDLNPVIQAALARHEDARLDKNISINLSRHEDPVLVSGDSEALNQVLDNLLSNAIKYTPSGGKIFLRLSTEGKDVSLEVEDTGIGIPRKHLDRIFERFYRVDKARSREMGGTGLGLSIVKHLVGAMGGKVTVASDIGVGSRFTVQLQRV